MKEITRKIRLIIMGIISPHKSKHKTKAQSMVEFALLLPILIVLLLVMVEYGFMLNTYLSLLDSTRQAARVYSTDTPFKLVTDNSTTPPTVTKVDDLTFYTKVANLLIQTLNSNSYKIQYDSSASSPDNILVSVITVDVDTTPNPDTFTFTRHPDSMEYFALNLTNGQLSKYKNNSSIENYMKAGGTPVDAGLLIVEIWYGYEGTLKVPNWFNMAFFPTDTHPVMLYASTIMPLAPAKPPRPTPTP